ncbi:MAG TPA: hypothetical protein VLA89_15890 [Gemmatimonadales bacterium]|nr:hypothetical protein [Gemmatimonadales bacterium]
MSERRIPGLPIEWTTIDGRVIDLSLVPDGPASEFDPKRTAKVAAWESWRDEVNRYRAYVKIQAEHNDDWQRWELAKCKHSPTLYYPTVYGWIFEPRGSGILPAIPYPFQVDYLLWMDARARGRGADGQGLVSKSRDMGATWYAILRALGKWLFEDVYVCKLISRKEDLVDDPGNMDSMMERMLVNIEMLPDYLRPPEWDRKIHKQKNKLIRPDNKNAILGESTSAKSGRGGRGSEGIVDESALIDGLLKLNSSLMQTVPHLFNISSEYLGVSEEFANLREAMETQHPNSVFLMDHWVHPYHDAVWLEAEHEKYINNEAGFQAEVMRNPYHFEDLIYPMARGITLLPEYVPYKPGNPLDVSIDPGRDDECAMHWITFDPDTGRDLLLESFESSHLPPEFYSAILLGCDLNNHPEFGLSQREIDQYNRMTEWTSRLPEVTLYGDPAGSANHTGESWYDKMRTFVNEHNPHKSKYQNGLTIVFSWRADDRYFGTVERGRRAALMNWLPKLDFNNTPEVNRTLLAIQKSRFEASEVRASEQRTPKHDWASHRRSALEYAAVNLDYSRAASTMDLTPYLPTDEGRAAD